MKARRSDWNVLPLPKDLGLSYQFPKNVRAAESASLLAPSSTKAYAVLSFQGSIFKGIPLPRNVSIAFVFNAIGRHASSHALWAQSLSIRRLELGSSMKANASDAVPAPKPALLIRIIASLSITPRRESISSATYAAEGRGVLPALRLVPGKP